MQKNKRKVLIGSPSYDGRIDVWYTNSLINSIKHSYDNDLNIELIPMWVSFDALIQRSRNDTVFIALQQQCDDLFWIDTDIEWKPESLFKLLNYDVDVVGGTYPKKSDVSEMYVGSFANMNLGPFGLKEVDALGTGFLRFSRKACQWLWDNSEKYVETPETPDEKTKDRRWIFDVVVKNGSLISEDISVCRRLREEGNFKIYLDTEVTCNHVGGKKYKGNFLEWYNKLEVKSKKENFILNTNNTSKKSLDYLQQYNKFY